MITFQQQINDSATGLGYQISSYVMMRTISTKRGFDWVLKNSDLKALRNTFDNLTLNIDPNFEERTSYLEFDDDAGFDTICNGVLDDHTISVYPTPNNYISDIFDQIKSELVFKENIRNKCEEFKNQFGSEVIAMHIRAGDFEDIVSGMFLCNYDYYENALAQLPEDLPVLVFSNNKERAEYILDNLSYDRSRFTIIKDIYQNNQGSDNMMERIDTIMDYDGTYRFNYNAFLIDTAIDNLNSVDISSPSQEQLNEELKKILNSLDEASRTKIVTGQYNYSYDLCLMSMCEYIIMGNSTYSLWATVLGNPTKVIYPMYWMQGHPEDNIPNVLRDLNGFNQTLSACEVIVGQDHYYPVENPDDRTITVVE